MDAFQQGINLQQNRIMSIRTVAKEALDESALQKLDTTNVRRRLLKLEAYWKAFGDAHIQLVALAIGKDISSDYFSTDRFSKCFEK